MNVVRGLNDLIGAPEDALALEMLETCQGLIGVYDENEYLRFSNAAFREAYFIEPGEVLNWTTLMRRNFEANRGTIIQTDDIDAWLSSVRSRRGKSPIRRYESDLHDGRWVWVVESMRPDGWIVYFGTDVTPLNASERQLRHDHERALRAAQTDALTGVSSRMHIMAQLENLSNVATEQNRAIGYACLLDIDEFKSINDVYGHSVGDQILTAFAQFVRKNVRLRDAFGRVGGEEFLLLFPEASEQECQTIVENLLANITHRPLVHEQPNLLPTFSAGLCLIDPCSKPSCVYARADEALYRAKTEGRNRLIIHRA